MTQLAFIPGPTVADAGGYRCIVADPMWEETGGGGRGAQNHYEVASTPEIIRIMLSAPCWRPARSAHLWLWVTDNFLKDGLLVMCALGFRYVRTRVWVKLDERRADGLAFGIGQYSRGQHELALLGVRGRCPPLCRDLGSVCMAPIGEHSAKPDKFCEDCERVSPGPRLEMFARRARPGWDVWGNEAPKAKEVA
jgi:N6-adenosine-specific RNA methylase IME4